MLKDREQQPDDFDQTVERIQHLAQNQGKQTEFRMPVLESKGIEAIIDFTLGVIELILDAKSIETATKFIAIIPSYITGYAGIIAVDQLLDTALADMLGAIGNVDYKEAIRSLDQAREAPTEEEKKHHRGLARSFLQAAYGNYESSIQEREKNFLARQGWMKKQEAELHLKAAQTALIVACIEHDMKYVATKWWTDYARMHFMNYFVLTSDSAEFRRETRNTFKELKWISEGPDPTKLSREEYCKLSKRHIRKYSSRPARKSPYAKLVENARKLDQLCVRLGSPSPAGFWSYL